MNASPAAAERFMRRALELAEQGRGAVEPNPLVGCVVVQGGEIVGEGAHLRFGGPHAEVHALAAAGERARGADLYCTLEPCAHQGKTPPCTAAVIAAGIRRVHAALRDPFPRVAGQGFAQLQAAGIEVACGLCEAEAREQNAAYLKRVTTGRPWVIAKWAMTLDGKIATRSGHSQWISSPDSRAIVHRLRGRVDAIVVGRRTAELDNPELIARPAEAALGLPHPASPAQLIRRTALRIVLDSAASLPTSLKLVQTARQTPMLIACGPAAPADRVTALEALGCEVLPLPAAAREERLGQLLDRLGERSLTNVLLEGGGELLGAARDAGLIDELHVFIAPLLFGGRAAPSPLAGRGVEMVDQARRLRVVESRLLSSGDLYTIARRP